MNERPDNFDDVFDDERENNDRGTDSDGTNFGFGEKVAILTLG